MKVAIHAWRDLCHPQAGGSERLVDSLATGLVDRGHDVTLLAGGPVGQRAYPVVDTGGTFGHYLRTPVENYRSVAKSDVLVDVASGMTYFSPLWSRTPSVMLATHIHVEQWSIMFDPMRAAVGRTLETRIAPHVYRNRLVLSISPSTTAGLVELGYSEPNIRPLPIGVDVAARRERSSTPEFVAVGRLVPYKRFDVLLKMWRMVRPVVGGHLTVVGDGPMRDDLERTQPPGTSFVGFVDEAKKHELLGRAWALVHPALHEGWGIVITEAGAHGTPSIGFDTHGVRDAIADGKTGILASDEEGFRAAWIEIAQDQRLRAALGEGALDKAERLSSGASIDAFESALVEAVERGVSGSVRCEVCSRPSR